LLTELQMNYLAAKWDHYVDSKIEQMQLTTGNLKHEERVAERWDPWMRGRIEYMYSYFDHKHDRYRVRERFVKHMN
jgi:hypothetical protein